MKSRIYIKRQLALQIIIYRMKQVLINMMDDEVKKDTSNIITEMEMYFEYFPKIRSIYGFFTQKNT